jgi:hypothetical protein
MEAIMSKLTTSLFAAASVLAVAEVLPLQAYAADNMQAQDEYRTSKLVGSKVYNAANENIGSIEEIVLKADGSMDEVVLSVGGFLGIGEKYVAVPFNNLKISRDGSGFKIVTEGTKDSLKALPDYRFYKGR